MYKNIVKDFGYTAISMAGAFIVSFISAILLLAGILAVVVISSPFLVIAVLWYVANDTLSTFDKVYYFILNKLG